MGLTITFTMNQTSTGEQMFCEMSEWLRLVSSNVCLIPCVLTCRLLGPAAFRNLMLLRQVPRLITIPYYEWVDKGVHVAHTYLQDKLRTEGQCDLPDFVLPE